MPENGFSSGVSYLGLGSPEEAQAKVFPGMEYTKKDISDYSSLAYTALMKQQEQAFTEAMYNYNNWYNSDSQRMQRRLAAGLNPYGLEGSAAASAASSPSAPVARSAGTAAKGMQAASSAIQNLIGVASQARELYDLLTVKKPLSEKQQQLIANKIPASLAESDWLQWLTYGDDFGPNSVYVQGSPRANMYRFQTNAQASRVEQLKFLVESLYPSQEARNKALKELDDYRLSVMEGQNDAILNIDTGYKGLDAFLRFLAYFLRDNVSKFF